MFSEQGSEPLEASRGGPAGLETGFSRTNRYVAHPQDARWGPNVFANPPANHGRHISDASRDVYLHGPDVAPIEAQVKAIVGTMVVRASQ